MKNKAAAFHPFAYLAAFGISGAMGGMLMCVNTLLMLDRGLSLAQVALGLSLFSITQVLLEVPSGMLGDLYGRKRIWMAAMLVRLCYLPLFLFASGPILLAGYVGNGAANALNSGTLDAMYLENWLHARGKKTLARGTALQQAVQYGSQAAGALLGGGLSTLKFFRPYSVNILACTALCVTGLLVAVFAIPADGAARRGTFSPRGIAAGFCAQAGQTVRLAKASPLVLLCLLSVLPYGFAGIGIEGYWQPRLLELLNGAQPGILLHRHGRRDSQRLSGGQACAAGKHHTQARCTVSCHSHSPDGAAGRAGHRPLGACIPCAVYHLLPDAGHVCLCGQCAGAKRDAGRSARDGDERAKPAADGGRLAGHRGGRAVAGPRQHSRAVAALRRCSGWRHGCMPGACVVVEAGKMPRQAFTKRIKPPKNHGFP